MRELVKELFVPATASDPGERGEQARGERGDTEWDKEEREEVEADQCFFERRRLVRAEPGLVSY